MKKMMILGTMLASFLLVAGAFAQTGIPDLSHSYIEWAYEGAATLSLYTLPDGSGNGLDQAYLPGVADGSAPTAVDGTITLVMLDGLDYPIAMFPFEDLWLESSDGGMVRCIGGTVADANTDAQGRTHWADPLGAGCWSASSLQVYINGDAVIDGAVAMWVNSPDINGDLECNLSDVGSFASDYFGAYQYRSDFNYDGVLNLSDIGLFARGVGAACP